MKLDRNYKEVRQVSGRAQAETGQRRKKEVAKEKPGKPTNQEELERNQEKMALWGGLTNSCEKKRSEKQRRKGKI